MNEGSWVGLDVHARSVIAGVIDAGSGEVRSLRVPPISSETVAWLKTLPAPVEDVPLVVDFRGGGPGVIVTSLRR